MSKPRQFRLGVWALRLGNVFSGATTISIAFTHSRVLIIVHICLFTENLSNFQIIQVESRTAEFDSVQEDVHVYQSKSTVTG